MKIVEPSTDIYYLDRADFTAASIPLQARLVPASPRNPPITWTLTLHTQVGLHKQDIAISPIQTHQNDAQP